MWYRNLRQGKIGDRPLSYDGFYEYPEKGEIGILQCKFYDDEGNLIGADSVRITD